MIKGVVELRMARGRVEMGMACYLTRRGYVTRVGTGKPWIGRALAAAGPGEPVKVVFYRMSHGGALAHIS